MYIFIDEAYCFIVDESSKLKPRPLNFKVRPPEDILNNLSKIVEAIVLEEQDICWLNIIKKYGKEIFDQEEAQEVFNEKLKAASPLKMIF